jgi:hypothetical protein
MLLAKLAIVVFTGFTLFCTGGLLIATLLFELLKLFTILVRQLHLICPGCSQSKHTIGPD